MPTFVAPGGPKKKDDVAAVVAELIEQRKQDLRAAIAGGHTISAGELGPAVEDIKFLKALQEALQA